MESKLLNQTPKLNHSIPFNRTSMESKPTNAKNLGYAVYPFNRTSMESKQKERREQERLEKDF